MIIAVLDIKEAHKDNPDCEMRIAQHPGNYWYCVDCGIAIPAKRIDVDTEGGALEFDWDKEAAVDTV